MNIQAVKPNLCAITGKSAAFALFYGTVAEYFRLRLEKKPVVWYGINKSV
jgi:hypothetical protein